MRILVIAAHPDDIEFGAAGSVAKWVKEEGAEVTFCLVTDGSAGSNKPDTDLDELVQVRQQEQCASAEILGVKDVRFLGYKDGALQPTLELRRDLTRLIREIRPERVVIQDPTVVYFGNFYINHPDHRATGEASLYAVFPSAGTRPIFSELLAEGFEPYDVPELYIQMSPEPDTFVDISDYIDQKIQSLLCHKSQLDESVVEMIKKWDTETGQKINTTYGEAFKVMRFVPESQPQEPEQVVAQSD